MKYSIQIAGVVAVLMILFSSCRQKNHREDIIIPPPSILVDTSDKHIDIIVLPNTDMQKQIQLTSLEMMLVDSLTKVAVENYNKEEAVNYKNGN